VNTPNVNPYGAPKATDYPVESIPRPNFWQLRLNHGLIEGKQLITVHRWMFCTSRLYQDDQQVDSWQTINPLWERRAIGTNERFIKIKYHWLPIIVVRIYVGNQLATAKVFWKQSLHLWGSGIAFYGPILFALFALRYWK
jgi:hypothetical protein